MYIINQRILHEASFSLYVAIFLFSLFRESFWIPSDVSILNHQIFLIEKTFKSTTTIHSRWSLSIKVWICYWLTTSFSGGANNKTKLYLLPMVKYGLLPIVVRKIRRFTIWVLCKADIIVEFSFLKFWISKSKSNRVSSISSVELFLLISAAPSDVARLLTTLKMGNKVCIPEICIPYEV